ncbi:cupin domain-containing protein [Sphingopyxis sp.]|uniref:cupin domain-containing protein n=1 Tax=Sphingopyxis sp. TaxID=1908224 RepID=UPI0025CC183C|nr:cupin domain-containing protein [Sphingopyxis sp.]
MKTAITAFALSALVAAMPAAAQTVHAGREAPAAKPAKVTLVYQHELPDVPGKSVKGVLVEYGPGAANASHVHARSALIYATVLDGAVLNQINGGPVRTFRKGENFTELPGDFHNISANASQTEPATLLAVFIVDTGDTILTTPATAPR